jgi:hypothetical protein
MKKLTYIFIIKNKLLRNDFSSKKNQNQSNQNVILSNLNSSNQHYTMINNTYIGDNSPKTRNFPQRIRSAINTKINYDKEKLYEENLHLKSELKKLKSEVEFRKKENNNLESEISKKDKILEELMIDTQNSLLSNVNNITEGGSINKNILCRITEVKIFFNILIKIFE